jgi:hypothetical protein
MPDSTFEAKFREWFHHCADVIIQPVSGGAAPDSPGYVLLYCDGLCDMNRIDQTVMPALLNGFHPSLGADGLHVPGLRSNPIEDTGNIEVISQLVFKGRLLIAFEETGRLIDVEICSSPERRPEEPNMEMSVLGPRDGFTEHMATNAALIRKRLRSRQLFYETYRLGTQSATGIGLFYMSDRVEKECLEQIRGRLQSATPEVVISASQLEEILGDSPFAVFPLFNYTGRPDFAVSCMMRGRVIVLMENIPLALIAPSNLLHMLKSPEDAQFGFLMVSFGRLLRLVGLVSAIFLPGFWIALVEYNHDQLPFPLLATITVSRNGIPLSAPLEMALMLLLLELFREAGVRLPKTVGQTLTVVGGLIIGEASIRAGLVSPSMVVVGSITAVATSALVNQKLSGTVSVLRLFVFLVSSLLGMFGFILSILSLVLYLVRLQSFGLPYLWPVSPPSVSGILHGIVRVPWKYMFPYFQKKKRTDREAGAGRDPA